MADDAGDKESGALVLAAIAELQTSIGNLAFQVAREHDRAQAREGVIDRLHEEVQRSRTGEIRELLRPLLTDLRRLRDDLLAQSRSIPPTISQSEAAILLESYADSVALILERCGVSAFRPELLSRFDPHQQHASGVAKTPRPELDGAIASVVSDGYTEAGTGQQLAPSRVVVYQHVDAEGQDGEPG